MSFVLHSCFHYFLSPLQMHRLQIVFSYTSRWLLPSLTQQAHQTHTHTVSPIFSVYLFFPFGTCITLPHTSMMIKNICFNTKRHIEGCSVYVSVCVCVVYVRVCEGRPVSSCVELTQTDTHFWPMNMQGLFLRWGWAEIIPQYRSCGWVSRRSSCPSHPSGPWEGCFLRTATKHPHKNRLRMTFIEEGWISNSKMYLLHGSVEYWILIGDFAVDIFV